MTTTYIASFSGGKDSVAMVLKLIEKGEPLDRIAYDRYWFRVWRTT